jgi:hypothetical protein
MLNVTIHSYDGGTYRTDGRLRNRRIPRRKSQLWHEAKLEANTKAVQGLNLPRHTRFRIRMVNQKRHQPKQRKSLKTPWLLES